MFIERFTKNINTMSRKNAVSKCYSRWYTYLPLTSKSYGYRLLECDAMQFGIFTSVFWRNSSTTQMEESVFLWNVDTYLNKLGSIMSQTNERQILTPMGTMFQIMSCMSSTEWPCIKTEIG